MKSSLGLIILTTSSCLMKGQAWPGIPTLVWPEGIDQPASDWFRALVVEHGVATSSAREYAKIIRPFLRFCRQRKRSWDSVDDDFLIIWREHLNRGEGVSIGRVNASLKLIFAFYRWAEEAKILRYRVGVYGETELPARLAHVNFPITAKRTFTKGRHGRVYGNWTTPLTLSERSQGSHSRHTPTEEEIRELHSIAVQHLQGERNSLMFSWAEEVGLRRAEFLRVGKSQMPTVERLAQLIERDEPWIIVIRRKGGSSKSITVPLDLVIRTLDFIEFARREIVDRCLKTAVNYQEPDEVFLSSTTGRALHPDSVTSIGRRTFKKAGIKHANVHRLRARYAVRTIETLVDAIFDGSMIGAESSWNDTILIKAAEAMGHSSPASLRPYLTYVLNRRIQTADATTAEKLASRLRQLKLHEGTLIRRLEHHEALQLAARHIEAGRNDDAAAILREMTNDLKGQAVR